MYNHYLDIFIQVADCGSFAKAGNRLFISANAVAKQVKLLEEHLGLTLFYRTNRGVTLTETGAYLYEESKDLIRRSQAVLKQAHLMQHPDFQIRIGVSFMNPANFLMDYWAQIADRYPNIHLRMIPFEDEPDAFQHILNHFGEKIDIICCPCSDTIWSNYCNAYTMVWLPIYISCPRQHPLATKKQLTYEDLYGHTLYIPKPDSAFQSDALFRDLSENHPQIALKLVDYIDYSTFNRAVSTNRLLFSMAFWDSTHPMMKNISVEWPHTISYGFIYPKNPSWQIQQFLTAIKENTPPLKK